MSKYVRKNFRAVIGEKQPYKGTFEKTFTSYMQSMGLPLTKGDLQTIVFKFVQQLNLKQI